MNIPDLRTYVLRPVLQHLELWTPAAENLMVGTHLQEDLADALQQGGGGPAEGFFQMEPATEQDLWANFLKFRPALAELVNGLLAPWPSRGDQVRTNLAYAAAIARVLYYRTTEPLPAADDVRALAAYYKAHYNTPAGAATVVSFATLYERFGAASAPPAAPVGAIGVLTVRHFPQDEGAVEGARHGIARSDRWPTVEKAFRAANPVCAGCGGKDPQVGIQVHHRHAFHEAVLAGRPDLEFDPRNLISLCQHEEGRPAKNCHLTKGHLDDFRSWNPNVDSDVKRFYGLDEDKVKADPKWQAEKAARPKPWDEWTHAERIAFRDLLDQKLPPDKALLEKYGVAVGPKPK